MGPPLAPPAVETEGTLRLYYTTVKALALQSSSHPGLPIEIILHICQLAEFTNPWPNNSLYAEVGYDRTAMTASTALLLESGSSTETKPWLCTPALPRALLRKAWRIEPRIHPAEPVMSRTHAFRPDELIIRIVKDRLSHQYRADSQGIELSWRYLTTRTRDELVSPLRTLDRKHEIWQWIEPGDSIEVALEAAGWYFPNIRSEWGASLRVHTLWEPSEKMLNLIYSGGS